MAESQPRRVGSTRCADLLRSFSVIIENWPGLRNYLEATEPLSEVMSIGESIRGE